jgi:hypothetical protein
MLVLVVREACLAQRDCWEGLKIDGYAQSNVSLCLLLLRIPDTAEIQSRQVLEASRFAYECCGTETHGREHLRV